MFALVHLNPPTLKSPIQCSHIIGSICSVDRVKGNKVACPRLIGCWVSACLLESGWSQALLHLIQNGRQYLKKQGTKGADSRVSAMKPVSIK